MITIIQTTSDTKEELESIADYLVNSNKIACAHIEAALSSVYVWEDEVRHSDEYTMKLKTTAERCPEVVDYIKAHHHYDLPQITWWEVAATAEYQAWVEGQTA